MESDTTQEGPSHIRIIDKVIPYRLLRAYLITLWTYERDYERSKAHDVIFERLEVDRFSEEGEKYYDEINTIICYAHVCCGLSVNRNNECVGKCGTKLTMQMSLVNMEEYCRKKGMFETETNEKQK